MFASAGTPQAAIPYLTTEQNLNLRLVQSSKLGKHGAFFAHPLESVSVHSERNPEDPRVTHDLVVEVDAFGNVKRKMAVAYGRATGEPELQRSWATLTETDHINLPDQETFYRVGLTFEERTYELTGLSLPFAGQGLVSLSALHNDQNNGILDTLNPANDLPYEIPGAGVSPQRRLIAHTEQVFYGDDLLNAAPLGQTGALALPYESYQLALTTGLVSTIATSIVAESLRLSGTAFDPTLLISEGKYVHRDANYWTASGRALFGGTTAQQHFYLPVEAVDPFGAHHFVAYDQYDLLVEITRDPLNNVTQSQNDYRVLAPSKIIDPNLNSVSVAFDALGMVVATAVAGKGTDVGDTLTDPTTRLEYDLLRWQSTEEPAFVHTFAREVHGSSNIFFQETFAYSDGFGRVAMQKVQAEPGPLPGITGTVDPRWVGTGRTVFNNKGNPVKQYEPFFSATSAFEDEDTIVATGVTPIIHYDPLDRVFRTELPSGSEARVDFDAWQQITSDPNDTVEGTRWLSEHQSGSADDQRAALLALKYANTPTTAQFDALGRVFLSQADNGPVDPANPSGSHYLISTRTAFDIEGNALSITDALGIVTIRQSYDVLKRRIEVTSPDAGTRLSVADVGNKPLRAWDNRGQTHRQTYDALQRSTRVFVKQGAAERLLLRTTYGEALDPAGQPQADPTQPPSPGQALNLRGRVHHAYDCAGLAINQRFDFKGNLLSASRRVAVDYTTEPNWQNGNTFESPTDVLGAASSLLEVEHFDTSSTYDALNRVTSRTTPDQNITVPTYNRASLLEAVTVQFRAGGSQSVITNVDYNARGQRTLCVYGNGTSTTYSYDAETFRLTELLTLRGGTKLQDLVYTYDPVGNIVAIRNNADNAPFFSGATVVSGDGLYAYDAIYRLTSATGREHPGTQPVDADPPIGTALPHANDLEALLLYTETYSYDDVGNIKQIQHSAGNGGTNGWTRNYNYLQSGVQLNNQLQKTSLPGVLGDVSLTYTYDAHGSMITMPHLQVMEWDYADRLKHTRPLASGTDQDTYFTYDGSGERVRKVFIAGGTITERIYLGGSEIYRERPATVGSPVALERQTLHVLDDGRRVAMTEMETIADGSSIGNHQHIWRFQLENHLGSAIVELDEHGAVITYEEYHPFGSTAFATTNGNAEVSAKRYRYTGKEKDVETGLYYHGARFYAPWLGRWIAADPLGVADGPNVYSYSRNTPCCLKDSSGQQSEAPKVDLPKVSPSSAVLLGRDGNGQPIYGLGDAGAATPSQQSGSASEQTPIEITVRGAPRKHKPTTRPARPHSPPSAAQANRDQSTGRETPLPNDPPLKPIEGKLRDATGSSALTTYESNVRGGYQKAIKEASKEAVGKIDQAAAAGDVAKAEEIAKDVSAFRNKVRSAAQSKLPPGGRALSEALDKERSFASIASKYHVEGQPFETAREIARAAGRSNKAISALGKAGRVLGPIGLAVGAALSVREVVNAPEGQKLKTGAGEAGAFVGGVVGATLGTWGATAVLAPALALAGPVGWVALAGVIVVTAGVSYFGAEAGRSFLSSFF